MSAAPPRKLKVVITDDVEDFRKLLRIALEGSQHFEVVGEGKTGREAVNLSKSLQPDVLLLDLSMPELDGLESLSPIQWESPNTKIVVLSGFAKERMGPMVRGLGATGYIEKGIGPKELVVELLKILEPFPPAGGSRKKMPETDEGTSGGGHTPLKGHSRDRRSGWISLYGGPKAATHRSESIGRTLQR